MLHPTFHEVDTVITGFGDHEIGNIISYFKKVEFHHTLAQPLLSLLP